MKHFINTTEEGKLWTSFPSCTLLERVGDKDGSVWLVHSSRIIKLTSGKHPVWYDSSDMMNSNRWRWIKFVGKLTLENE